MRLLLCAVVFFVACAMVAARCPSPNKIYDYTKKPSCRDDSECKNGQICCTNPAHVKSCTYPDPYGGGGSKDTSSSGAGVYCEGVKCQPFEVCKPDPANKRRMKCQRA